VAAGRRQPGDLNVRRNPDETLRTLRVLKTGELLGGWHAGQDPEQACSKRALGVAAQLADPGARHHADEGEEEAESVRHGFEPTTA
jgi:hypothetical protein